MKRPLFILLYAFLLVVEICLIVIPFLPSQYCSPRAARAFYAWRQNPTPETEQAWNKERQRVQRTELIFDAVLLGLILGNGFAIYTVRRKAFPKQKQQAVGHEFHG